MGKYDDAERALTQALKNNPKDVQALIEMGNLYLQTGRNNNAITEFRQAVAVGPGNEDTHKALALALLKVERLDEAEGVARTAIKNLDREQRWPLHLTLAKILTQRGDNTSERQYYEEAMSEVTQAIDRRADRPEVYLHSGIIRYKLGDLVRSWQEFRKCHKMAPDNYEAERNAKLVRRQLLKASPLMKTTTWGGAVLAAVCVVQLWWIWRGFFSPNKIISEKMLLILVPLLLGLFVVSFLLPVLVHLKLPGGFEAQLSQPKTSDLISSGPKGDVSFSNTSSSVASGALGRD
jgi:tetratricopeptide (TPR) repeat protein